MKTLHQLLNVNSTRRMPVLLGLAAGLLAVSTASSVKADTVADFTFEQFTSATGQTAGPYNAEINNTGFTTGAVVTGAPGGAAPVFSSPAGNGSAHSYSANGFAVGGYYQFSINSTNFSNLAVSYDQAGSGSGPRDFALQYSTTGASGTFTTLAGSAYQLTTSSFSSATANAALTHTFDLSSIAALNANANDVFRVVVTDSTSISGSTIAAAGTDRVDNFTVTTVPEPTTVLGGALVFGAFGWSQRRRFAALRRLAIA